MTEKNQNFTVQELSEQEQYEFRCDEEFFKRQFSALSCPELPESLSAQNLWNRICAGEGDGEMTVDPSTVEIHFDPAEQQETVLESHTNSSVKKPDNVIAFPQKEAGQQPGERRSLSILQRRRRWAVACTLVLAVGLSAVFWKYGKSSSGAGALVQNQSTADTAVEEIMVESAAAEEEATKAEEETAGQTAAEAVVQQEENGKTTDEGKTADATAVQPTEASAEEDVVQAQEKTVTSEEIQAREDIRQRMLDSLASNVESRSTVHESASENDAAESTAVTGEEEQSNPATGGGEGEDQKPEPNGIMMAQAPQEEEDTTEQPVEKTVQTEEAIMPQEQTSDTQVQSYSMKGGSLTYDPSSGVVTVFNRSGEQTAVVNLSVNAQLLCSDHSFAELVSDEETMTVTLTVYSLEDLSSPEQVGSICHEGTLFDIYQSGTDSYTLMTSVWFTREQIESGDFLPTVDGNEIDVKKINIIEGYGQQEQINYLLTSTLTTDSIKTRADLYLK